MFDLKAMYESMGFTEVITYIQSGNVLFNSDTTDPNQLAQNIKNAIQNKFGFDVPVIIRTMTELQQVITNNPFAQEPDFDEKKLYVTFLSEAIKETNRQAIQTHEYLPDRFKIIGEHIYVYYAEKISNSKLIQSLFEKKYNVTATTRNWNSVNKLYELAQN